MIDEASRQFDQSRARLRVIGKAIDDERAWVDFEVIGEYHDCIDKLEKDAELKLGDFRIPGKWVEGRDACDKTLFNTKYLALCDYLSL